MSTLKDLRISRNLTQRQAAEKTGISLRSYIAYENDPTKENTIKYRFLLQEIENVNVLDEEHGILQMEDIRHKCEAVFADYPVEFCYLFGSYAKGTPSETSDVDLLISTEVKGLRFYELTEKLRESLKKKVDLLDLKQLAGNEELLHELLKDGVKIYG